jgi:hypothetical protein
VNHHRITCSRRRFPRRRVQRSVAGNGRSVGAVLLVTRNNRFPDNQRPLTVDSGYEGVRLKFKTVLSDMSNVDALVAYPTFDAVIAMVPARTDTV